MVGESGCRDPDFSLAPGLGGSGLGAGTGGGGKEVRTEVQPGDTLLLGQPHVSVVAVLWFRG